MEKKGATIRTIRQNCPRIRAAVSKHQGRCFGVGGTPGTNTAAGKLSPSCANLGRVLDVTLKTELSSLFVWPLSAKTPENAQGRHPNQKLRQLILRGLQTRLANKRSPDFVWAARDSAHVFWKAPGALTRSTLARFSAHSYTKAF